MEHKELMTAVDALNAQVHRAVDAGFRVEVFVHDVQRLEDKHGRPLIVVHLSKEEGEANVS